MSFGDNFGGLDTASWSYNTTFQSTANEGGQMVLRSNGAGGGSYVGNFYRNGSIVSGQSAVVDFKVDGTNTFAHFSLEGVANNACRVGLVTWSGKLMVQWVGCNWNNVTYTDMVNPMKVNTWYRLTMSVNDSTGFTLSVRERDTGAAAVTHNVAMPGTGQTWRFHHWIDAGTAWLDNYAERSDGTQTTVYVGGHYEKNVTTGVSTSYYAFGGKPVAMRQGGTVSFLHGDHLGSASLATDASGGKIANSEQRYTPFGTPRLSAGGLPTSFTYTGQKSFMDFGMMDYGARMYSPLLGRFLSADTIYDGGLKDPQGLNRYSYVKGHVMNANDPTGHECGPVSTPSPSSSSYCYGGGSSNSGSYGGSVDLQPAALPEPRGLGTTVKALVKAINDYFFGDSSEPNSQDGETSTIESPAPIATRNPKPDQWSVGDPIDMVDEKGDYPSWETARSRYWKNKAVEDSEQYSSQNIGRMKAGNAPVVRVKVKIQKTGEVKIILVQKEIHHIKGRNVKNPHNPKNLQEVWPWEHAAVDDDRNTGYDLVEVISK